MSNSISHKNCSRLDSQITDIGLSNTVIEKLQQSGIVTVRDVLYELASEIDVIRIGLNDNEVAEINGFICALGFRLSVFDEPLSILNIDEELVEKLEEMHCDSVSDVLRQGFSGLLDGLSGAEALKIADKLQRAGYLLVGYPGYDDPEICEKLWSCYFEESIDYIDISEETKKRLLLTDIDMRLKYFARRPVRLWYAITQDYDACVSIVEQLEKLYFRFVDQIGINDLKLGKETFLKKYTVLYQDLREVVPCRLYHTLKNNGITTVEQLVAFSALELKEQKLVGESALSSLREALHKGRLLLREDYIIRCENCSELFIGNDNHNTKCDKCIATHKKLEKISKLDITISGPEYGCYTDIPSGFTLYANIKNITEDLLKVKLCDFYIVENDQQIAPRYYLRGYSFEEEIIMPKTVKSAAKIWSTERFEYTTFILSESYVVLTLEIANENRKRMNKFVYRNNQWVLDDYYSV